MQVGVRRGAQLHVGDPAPHVEVVQKRGEQASDDHLLEQDALDTAHREQRRRDARLFDMFDMLTQLVDMSDMLDVHSLSSTSLVERVKVLEFVVVLDSAFVELGGILCRALWTACW